MWTAFDYMYRDAGNFKAFGFVILKGDITRGDRQLIRSRLSGGDYFIAEQVGVPPLYNKLYECSGAPTPSDHCWHEFVGFREMAPPEDTGSVISLRDFLSRFVGLEEWDESLSPHSSCLHFSKALDG